MFYFFRFSMTAWSRRAPPSPIPASGSCLWSCGMISRWRGFIKSDIDCFPIKGLYYVLYHLCVDVDYLQDGRCSMADACSNPADAEGVYLMIMQVNTGLLLVHTGHVTLILFSDWSRTSSDIITPTGHHLASTTTPHGEYWSRLSA